MKKLCMILPLALILCFMVGCQDKEAMAELEEFKAQAEVEEQNKEILRRFFEEVWGLGKLDALDDIVSNNIVVHVAGRDIEGIENFKKFILGYRNAFPDIKFTIEEIIAQGDKVAERFTVRGTHQGELPGIPPTGKQIKITSIDIARYVDGKMVERWGQPDFLGMMQQLGMELKPKEGEK
jgi:steroid delta-isomerase-like uncharacterized protein